MSAVLSLVEQLVPCDALEADHRRRARAWLASTNDVCRRVRPATPDPHLVSYFVPVDVERRRVLLADHRRAGLWLPPGGHVEPGEHPVETVRREAREELGVDAQFLGGSQAPFFLTWTLTRGPSPHTDVSFWFLLRASVDDEFAWDHGEFADIRWWSGSAVRAEPTETFDPHLGRFLRKLADGGLF